MTAIKYLSNKLQQNNYCDHIPGEIKPPSLGEVGSEEFLQKLTTQITEMVSARITQGKRKHFFCQ